MSKYYDITDKVTDYMLNTEFNFKFGARHYCIIETAKRKSRELKKPVVLIGKNKYMIIYPNGKIKEVTND